MEEISGDPHKNPMGNATFLYSRLSCLLISHWHMLVTYGYIPLSSMNFTNHTSPAPHVSTNLRIPPVSHWNCPNPSIFMDKPKLGTSHTTGLATAHYVYWISQDIVELKLIFLLELSDYV